MEATWIFWDGDCDFCSRIVAWVERQDRGDLFLAVPYQRAPRPPMTDELARRCARAVHILRPDGALLSAGRASLYVLGQLGWRRLAFVLGLPPFVWAVELGYWFVARNRSWLAGLLVR